MLFGLCMFITGACLGKFVFGRDEVQSHEKESAVITTPKITLTEDWPESDETAYNKRDWNLVLVNKDHSVADGYVPELAEVENNYYFDARAVQYLKEMLAAGRSAGLDFCICSAYRTIEKQTELFEKQINSLMAEGMDYEQACLEASTSVAVPGHSEHHLGLAVDIVARDYQLLDEYQAETAEAKWLKENCWRYGFILRYPPDKTEITGIIFEPWHYRYVGVEAAREIMEQGICLEEYVEEL